MIPFKLAAALLLTASVILGGSVAQANAAGDSLATSILFPKVSLRHPTAAYAALDRTVSGSVGLATSEPFTSYGLRLTASLISSSGLPAYRTVFDAQYAAEPGGQTAADFSFDLPKALTPGSYQVALSALSPSGETLAVAKAGTAIDLRQPANSLVLSNTMLKIRSAGTDSDPSRSSAIGLGQDGSVVATLPATALADAIVVPELRIFRSVHPGVGTPFKTVYGQKTSLGNSSVQVSIPLPTGTEGLYYGSLQLDDASAARTSVSNAVEFPYEVGSSFAVLGGVAVRSVQQYGPITKIQGDATVNFNGYGEGGLFQVLFALKNKQGTVLKSSKVTVAGTSGIVAVPFSLLTFGALNADAYVITAGIDDTSTVTGSLPARSGTAGLVILLLSAACALAAIGVAAARRMRSPKLAVLAAALFAIGAFQLIAAPKVHAADDYGQTNTTFMPADGTNLGSYPACGGPDGTDYAANAACKIRISGALAFDSQYLEHSNGGYTGLTYRFDYLEYQVYVNGVLTADPYDTDSQRIALSGTGNSNGNDLFSFTLTPHFTGSYQIKLVPHYYFYFNSCHGAFNEDCTSNWWLSDQATFTATVTANAPTLTLPATIQNPAGASSVSLNYRSSGLATFTLADSTGAPSYPKQVTVGASGNFSPVAGIAPILVTRTPTQNLTATGQSVSDAPDASSLQQLADPIPLRQGDYQEWKYNTGDPYYATQGPYSDVAHMIRDPSTLYEENATVIHDATLYPGDQLDFSRTQTILSSYVFGFRNASPLLTFHAYIPVKRYGSVSGAPDDQRISSCTQQYGLFTSTPIQTWQQLQTEGSCSVSHQPVVNNGDTYLPAALSNVSQACTRPLSRGLCQQYTVSYGKSEAVNRNYTGLSRTLFPFNATTMHVTGNTSILSGTGVIGTTPTATLTGPSVPFSAGSRIDLYLALSNFAASKSSGITVSPVPATISSACASLGAGGGPCADIQNPATDTAYMYQGWACDGLNGTGSCITSNALTVQVTAAAGCLGACGIGPGSLTYGLTATPSEIASGGTYTLTAIPGAGSLTPTSVFFQCSSSDTFHASTGTDVSGNPTYGCTAQTNAGALPVTVTATADASLAGHPDSKPTAPVTVDSQGQTAPQTVGITTTYFCSGD